MLSILVSCNTQKQPETVSQNEPAPETSVLQDFGEKWVRAFCSRDGKALFELCYDEDVFISIGGYRPADDKEQFAIGLSSPWPWYYEEAKVIVDADRIGCILFWRTSASIDSERLTLLYTQTDSGLRLTGVDRPYPDISSKAAFVFNYEYGFPPFDEYVQAFQYGADNGPDSLGFYYNPALAAENQLRIENAKYIADEQADDSVNVTFTWEDGSITAVVEQPGVKGENGAWIVTQILFEQ